MAMVIYMDLEISINTSEPVNPPLAHIPYDILIDRFCVINFRFPDINMHF